MRKPEKTYMRRFINFFKSWMLVIGMVIGASSYLVYRACPVLHPAGPFLEKGIGLIQPVLLFTMLFISFCHVKPSQIRARQWHWRGLLIQGGIFSALAVIVMLFPLSRARIPLESVMLCLICPTATSCSVMTHKLGGNMATVVTYTILINILTAVIVSLFVPLLYPEEGLDFAKAFALILAKVFPLLIMPLVAAWLVRYLMPRTHAWVLGLKDLPFFIWAVALMLAIAVSTRAIVHYEKSHLMLLWITLASALSCAFQFWIGKKIGKRDCISSGQALGQKNTVFLIWLAYTFMDPILSIVGGLYSIWHNIFNSWQLAQLSKTTSYYEKTPHSGPAADGGLAHGGH